MNPVLLGVLNTTPDSFSDGGRYLDPTAAIAHGRALAAAGAEIVDVGGESTRPGAAPVPEAEELRRTIPVVAALAGAGIRVSIDTRSAAVAEAALASGATIVNDVSGATSDPRMLPLLAASSADLVLMHSRGPAATTPRYTDVVGEVRAELAERVAAARAAGVPDDRLVVDPGIGFAKGAAENWALLAHLDELRIDGIRLLVGVSRKRFLATLAPDWAPAEERDLPTAVLSALLAEQGVWGLRVHDVAGTRTALAVVDARDRRRSARRPVPAQAAPARPAPTAEDRIRLSGLTVRAFHGVHPEEREQGQDFVVDVELVVPLRVAAATDDVLATVHYGELAWAITAAVERDPVDLIETVAERIARLALADDRVERAIVTVHKPQAPIGLPFSDVAVRIERVADRLLPRRHVVVAIGGNLGDPAETTAAAVAALGRLPGLTVTAASAPLETVALTVTGPDPDKPRYVNRVIVGETVLEPRALLDALLGIERVFGRQRLEHWGDRTLDLDLIAYGEQRIDESDLTVPHPRAHEREFVLAPWLEVEPDAVLPGRGRVAALLAALRSTP